MALYPLSESYEITATATTTSAGYITVTYTIGGSGFAGGTAVISGTNITSFNVSTTGNTVKTASFQVSVGYGGAGTWYIDQGSGSQVSASAVAYYNRPKVWNGSNFNSMITTVKKWTGSSFSTSVPIIYVNTVAGSSPTWKQIY